MSSITMGEMQRSPGMALDPTKLLTLFLSFISHLFYPQTFPKKSPE
jgi:hypothetical protein